MSTNYGRFTVNPYTPHLGADVNDLLLDEFDDELVKLLYDAAPQARSPWHSDATFRDCPPYASLLLAKILPPAGGDAFFGNMERIHTAPTRVNRPPRDNSRWQADARLILTAAVRPPRIVGTQVGLTPVS